MPITAEPHKAAPNPVDKALIAQMERIKNQIKTEATREHERFLTEGNLQWERGEQRAIDSTIDSFLERLTHTHQGRTALAEMDSQRPYMEPHDRDELLNRKNTLALQALETDAKNRLKTDSQSLERQENNGITTGAHACLTALNQCTRSGETVINSLAAEAAISNAVRTGQDPLKYLEERKTTPKNPGGLSPEDISAITAIIDSRRRGIRTP